MDSWVVITIYGRDNTESQTTVVGCGCQLSLELAPHAHTHTEFMASSSPTPLKNHYYQRVTSSFALLSRSLVAATYVKLDCIFCYLIYVRVLHYGPRGFCCYFPLVIFLGRGDA